MNPISDITEWLPIAPWRTASMSLIAISADHSTARQEWTLTGKRALMASHDGSGTLLASWCGQYRADVRTVLPNQRQEVADAIA